MEFLKSFILDCKYYDLEKKEIKAILRYVKLKNKSLLDIGTGIGRLAFPLSKYAKKVVAIDKNKKLIDFCKKRKSKKIKFIKAGIENFIKSYKEKFDIILIAWPVFNNKIIKRIGKLMHKESKIIFITCDNNSVYEKIPDKIEKKKKFKEDIQNKKEFIKLLIKEFNVAKKKKIDVFYSFPNEKEALNVLMGSLRLWFGMRIDKNKEQKLREIIKRYKKNKKVIIPERIFFYLMEQK